MKYTVMRTAAKPDWSQVTPLSVNQYCWGGDYRPAVEARMVLVEHEGFWVRMDCEETDPRAVYQNNNDMVCEDSCLECFANFKPELPESGYINFEMNANGVLHSAYGKDRYGRKFLRDMGVAEPPVTVEQTATSWSVEFLVPLSLIEQVYGNADFAPGDTFTGDFYKCGDKTHTQHYASWTVIDNPTPDFHLSRFFGTLTIG